MKNLFSTRSSAAPVDAAQAILSGLAPDGGLYTPQSFPQFDLTSLQNLSYQELAIKILTPFLTGYSDSEVRKCVESAYSDKFDTPEVTPVREIGAFPVLELFHGPTAAFKDVALSMLPHLMAAAKKIKDDHHRTLILTATSGDTGSAALYGFKNVEGIDIQVFYPESGISPIQRAQMTTMDGSNLGVAAVCGNFDSAQSQVKGIFSTFPESESVQLSSANSINFGRLAPQIVYYFSAYMDLVRNRSLKLGDKVNFCVPTGNFGDILAGYFAFRSGLPVARFICASNTNRVLTDFLESGTYNRLRDFVVTSSPSMDILISSNLERLLYLSNKCDCSVTASLMEELKTKGSYKISDASMEEIRSLFCGWCSTEEQTLSAISSVFEDHGYLLDPHTAVAWSASSRYQAETGDTTPTIILATASPFKFPRTVLKALGSDPIPQSPSEQMKLLENISGQKAPAFLSNCLNLPDRFSDVIKPEEMMAYVQKKAGLL